MSTSTDRERQTSSFLLLRSLFLFVYLFILFLFPSCNLGLVTGRAPNGISQVIWLFSTPGERLTRRKWSHLQGALVAPAGIAIATEIVAFPWRADGDGRGGDTYPPGRHRNQASAPCIAPGPRARPAVVSGAQVPPHSTSHTRFFARGTTWFPKLEPIVRESPTSSPQPR